MIAGGTRTSTLTVPERGFHTSTGLVPAGDAAGALLQIAFVTRDSRKRTQPFARLHTLFIAAERPAGAYLGADQAQLFAWRRGTVATAEDDPFPVVTTLNLNK